MKPHYRTLDELKTLALPYKTRGELYKKNQRLYMALYTRGILEEACKHMKPSRKKNKFVVGTLNVAKVLGPAFGCSTLKEFREKHESQYTCGLRHKINFVEFFENKDDPKYLQDIIVKLGEENASKFVVQDGNG